MVNPLLRRLHVPVEHCGIRENAEAVSRAMNIKPFVGSHFSLEDFIVNAIVEDFGAAAGHAAQAGFSQCREYFANAHVRDAGKMHDLDRGECFDSQIRAFARIPRSMSR